MKKSIITVLAAVIAFSTCTKTDSPSLDNITVQEEGAKSVVFAATAEAVDEDSSQTRATFDNTRRCASWEAGDMAVINGLSFESIYSGPVTSFRRSFGHDGGVTREVRPIFVSSQSSGYDGQGPSMLVDDGGVGTKWCADGTHRNNGGLWDIVVTAGEPTVLKTVNLWNASDADKYPTRVWSAVKIYGSQSKDGGWTEIRAFENLSLSTQSSGLAGSLEVNSQEPYMYYKLNVIPPVSGGGVVMQMADMKFVVVDDHSVINAPYTAYYPGSVYKSGVLTLPRAYNETWEEGKFDMPMYAVSDNTDLRFKNLCGVLKIVVRKEQLDSVKLIKVSCPDRALSGTFTIIDGTAVMDSSSTSGDFIYVNYATPVHTSAEGTAFYIPIPAQTYGGLKIKIYTGAAMYSMATRSGLNVNVERNSVYTVNFIKRESSVSGALPGVFTVNADYKLVRFARGNLTYNVDTKKWAFYEHQYDRASGYDAHLISLHNWGYVPTHSIYPGAYYSNYSGWRGNLPANADFGWVFGGAASPWQNLTSAEWSYLLNTRTVAGTGERYLRATINSDVNKGVYGLILYPNNYTAQTDATSYTSSQWLAMEAEGCVFLPAAGLRYQSDVKNIGTQASYWTASSSLTAGTDMALMMISTPDTAPHTTSARRSNSYAVRLVTEE